MRRIAYENEPQLFSPEERTYLQGLLRGNFEPRDAGWSICRVAGHVALPNGDTLYIRSRKAPSAALFAWLAHIDPALSGTRFIGDEVEAAETGELSALVARAYVEEIVDALRMHGLNRHYHRRRVQTGTIRGSIDFPRLVRAGGELSRMPCVAWERLPHTPLNRTLSAALSRLRSDAAMRRACRASLPEAASVLSDIPPLPDHDLLTGRSQLQRNERALGRAFALARLLLRATGFQEGSGESGGAFLVNLDWLFEQTVASAFAQSALAAAAKVPVRYGIHKPDGTLGTRSMEMDVFVADSPVGPVVIDAKYKTRVASSNLQQMVTYCLMTGAQHAVLVFPEGFVDAGTVYQFDAPGSSESSPRRIMVSTAELKTGGQTMAEWREAAGRLVTQTTTSLFSPSATSSLAAAS